MADIPPTHYEEILAQQLEMNPHTLAHLERAGLRPDTKVRLDFMYLAPDKTAAEALQHLLKQQTDYDVSVRSEGGLLRKKWLLSGQTQPTSITREILDQWVTWMVAAGEEAGCEFDGWGTEV